MMKTTRRRSGPSTYQVRSNAIRLHGRVTKEDIKAARLRRWDGRARITTDWFNLFHEPELCFPDGDLLIYLREPGQSSRGPAFRVHKALLNERGFDFLLDRCIDRPPMHPGTECLLSACHGCDYHASPSELYIPAPNNSELDAMFDHHITTRNFFAWLYALPLVGRSLGRSLIDLKERIDYYRPENSVRTSLDMVSFAERQNYLDFRECVDHALAALLLAEHLQIEDLWIDAFTHCVGMSHRGLNSSLEYWAVSYDTRLLIHEAQLEMESRVDAVRKSVKDFFEDDLSGNFLGLSQIARDHFDHFRSRLHGYHIEQHGFWPPDGFEDGEDETVEHAIYASMYCDFRNLYHHLVDPKSSTGITDLQLSMSGGICTTQNIQAFDLRHGYESLPNTLPLLPLEPDVDVKTPGIQRPKSWNPLMKRKIDKHKKKSLRSQALIAASNRDWTIMECPLVRWYSEFELKIILDESEQISMVDGRKVRWILIYAILQNLISVMQTPPQVRNVEGVTYLLCCRPPKSMPWKKDVPPQRPVLNKRHSMIEPDNQYLHSNTLSSESLPTKNVRPTSKHEKEKRRQSLPAHFTSISSRPSTSRSISIRQFITSFTDDKPTIPKSGGYCEILVPSYGNGLNEVDTSLFQDDTADVDTSPERHIAGALTPTEITAVERRPCLSIDPGSPLTEKVPELTPTSTTSVSRESSYASAHSAWSKPDPADHSDSNNTTCVDLPNNISWPLADLTHMKLPEISVHDIDNSLRPEELNHILDEEGCLRTAHFNTEAWDNMLGLAY